MSLIALLLVSWSAIIGAVRENPAEDQFGEEVRWESFSQKPFVLVFADREAAERARTIGASLHKEFNGEYTAPEEHLRGSPASERVKIIPVAALPDVPGVFKWLFRRGFKKESPVGVILDWDSQLAKASGYRTGTVSIAIKIPGKAEVRTLEVRSASEAIAAVRDAIVLARTRD